MTSPAVRAPRISRDCEHPRANHQHGTRNAYDHDRCRCEPCTTANREYTNWRLRQIAYQRPTVKSRPPVTDATGTHRRIEALETLGYSKPYLARRVGVTVWGLYAPTGRILISTRDAIAALYDELWDKAPEPDNSHEMRAVARVKSQARKRRLQPPMAWDDETIDDPNAKPHTPRLAQHSGSASFDIADVEHLAAFGYGVNTLAERLGVQRHSLLRRLARDGRDDLIELLRAAS